MFWDVRRIKKHKKKSFFLWETLLMALASRAVWNNSLVFISFGYSLTLTVRYANACDRIVTVSSNYTKHIKKRPQMGSLLMAPAVGLEPTTDRLTADCSTTELRWNNKNIFT